MALTYILVEQLAHETTPGVFLVLFGGFFNHSNFVLSTSTEIRSCLNA